LRIAARTLLIVGLVLLLTTCASARDDAEPTTELRVAAAADLRFAMVDLQHAFAQVHPGVELAVTYGSSGQFFQQLQAGAPFDMFLSADLDYPRRLAADGLARPEDVFSYAVGRLVLWAPNDSPVDVGKGLLALSQQQVRRLAIANPEHAPYGKAAVAALKSARVYEQVADRLVLGENVSQAAEFVLSGNADAGVIAMSLALAPEMGGKGRFSEVPLDTYPPLEQGGVVLAQASAAQAAQQFRTLLLSAEGRSILQRYGFLEPSG
jgi:molybdate transport system substrate-binding protein